ncbi:MAG: polysaccharide lyase [Proteobacteria bacterium]|nr:polysaccharide lyase [Pseudomonadota bacterium]
MPRILAGYCAVLIGLFAPAVCGAADRGAFGPFERSLNSTPYGYIVVPDPTGTAPTATVERFEVRPGDCSANRGWDDCATDRERSELSERGDREPAGSTRWYGWSFFLPAGFPEIHPAKLALGQFHQEKSHVIWMFQQTPGGLYLDDQVAGHTRRYHPLIDAAALRGRWHRIEVAARWTRNEDGYFRVWVNGIRKVDYAGRTMSADIVYFKYGVYRSFISRFRNATGTQDVPTQTVLYANIRRAESRAQLAPR